MEPQMIRMVFIAVVLAALWVGAAGATPNENPGRPDNEGCPSVFFADLASNWAPYGITGYDQNGDGIICGFYGGETNRGQLSTDVGINFIDNHLPEY
jgi:hypothetical protein